jgi:hypothetical protein
MLWLAARARVERKLLVLSACACAREALVYVPKLELRPLKAIETAEAWTRGEATLTEVRSAAYAAYAATTAAAAATDAADAADATAAHKKSLATSAYLVRLFIPASTVQAAMERIK